MNILEQIPSESSTILPFAIGIGLVIFLFYILAEAVGAFGEVAT